MPFVLAVLTRTPFYVWLLFAWLVWRGVQALRPRTQPAWRVLLVPGVFILSGVLPLAWRAGGVELLAAWAAGAVLLFPLGWRNGPVLVPAPGGGVTRAGSPWPLVRNVVVFTAQYVLVVAAAVRPDGRDLLAVAGRAVSGATAGYFAGWAAAAWVRYRAAVPTPAA